VIWNSIGHWPTSEGENGMTMIPTLALSLAALGGDADGVLHVPEEYPTIQGAVDAASNGNEIRISPGTYFESVLIPPIDLTIVGDGPRESVILDGEHQRQLLIAENLGGHELRVSSMTLTRGYGEGASISASGGRLFIDDCEFVENWTTGLGSVRALDCMEVGLTNCDFIENEEVSSGTGYPALCILYTPIAHISSCSFLRNTGERSAAFLIGVESAEVRLCLFQGNSCYDSPGGMMIRGMPEFPEGVHAQVTDCVFQNNPNSYHFDRGSVDVHGATGLSHVDFVRCEFRDNTDGGLSLYGSLASASVQDSLFCNNNADYVSGNGGDLNNISDLGGNSFLSDCPEISACCLGDWCKDVASATCDLAGGVWTADAQCGSFSHTCDACAAADIVNDGEVRVEDLLAIIGGWGTDNPLLDIDGDGTVGVADLLAVLEHWGPCPG